MTSHSTSQVICDGCGFSRIYIEPAGAVNLVPPWRIAKVHYWGDFHACSSQCEALIRARYERPEPAVVVEATTPDREDPTLPDIPSSVHKAVKI